MDNLFKQTRLRFSGTGPEKKEESESSKDRRIPPQKTQSFKDKKKEPNWFQKQVTWQMSQDYDSINEDDHAIAVAAVAFAITSLEAKENPRISTVPIKSKKENPTILIPQQHDRLSKKFSEEITQSSDITETQTNTKKPEKLLLPSPSFKKTPSSLEKELSGSFKSGSGILKPNLPPQTQTPVDKQPSGSFTRGGSTKPLSLPAETKRQSSTRAGMGKSQADIWEESELVKITERYEEQKSTILSWEEKKKTKAKRRLNKAERELERNRAKATAKYRRDMQNIDQVVGGAKAKAMEKKKNDELKVKEKANTIRKTGKVPNTCSCF